MGPPPELNDMNTSTRIHHQFIRTLLYTITDGQVPTPPKTFIKYIIKSFGKVQETISRNGFLVVEDKLDGGFWSNICQMLKKYSISPKKNTTKNTSDLYFILTFL